MSIFEKDGWEPAYIEEVTLLRVSPASVKSCFEIIAKHMSTKVVKTWVDSRFTTYYTAAMEFADGTTTEITLTPMSGVLLLSDGRVQLVR